jgi:hypothetical protein
MLGFVRDGSLRFVWRGRKRWGLLVFKVQLKNNFGISLWVAGLRTTESRRTQRGRLPQPNVSLSTLCHLRERTPKLVLVYDSRTESRQASLSDLVATGGVATLFLSLDSRLSTLDYFKLLSRLE